MYRILKWAAVALSLLAVPAWADEVTDVVTISFIGGNVTASTAGLHMTNGNVLAMSEGFDHFPLVGTVSVKTGAATDFSVSPPILTATFGPGTPVPFFITSSVNIVSSSGPVITGTIQNGMLTANLNGSGAFSGTFDVTSVNPAVLATFGLSSFSQSGSVSFTFSHDVFTNGTLNAVLGGGTVTFTTPTPEPGTLMFLGVGLAALALFGRRLAT